MNECIGPDIEITNSRASIVGQASTDGNAANNSDSHTFTTVDGPCSDNNSCTDDACVSGACAAPPTTPTPAATRTVHGRHLRLRHLRRHPQQRSL